jgi:hypothetical protein
MAEKGDLKALFRLFWNNINQQMMDDLNIAKTLYKNMLKEKLKKIYRKIGLIAIIMTIVLILKNIVKLF